MNKKIAILALVIFASGLLSLYVCGQATPESNPQQGMGESVQSLKARVSALETQVAALQKQIKALESRASKGLLAIPDSRYFPGSQIPPGATQHDYNGIKYWTVPLSTGK
jgi:outer membrane murein-binding lipoprotein Lpp